VDRKDAEETAARLARRHSNRARYQWSVRQGPDGEWLVVKVGVSPRRTAGPLKAIFGAQPKPPQAADPRPFLWKDVGGPYAG
jgi:hypothetical protein